MEFNFLWLLALPVFFGLGWLAARIDLKQLLKEAKRVPQSYFGALNLLLSERHEKALSELVSVAHNHPDNVELHFALGSLYRRKGEIDKAISLHQSIVNRSNLPASVKSDALEALGTDFLKAGLFDRAEESFSQLLNTDRANTGKEALLGIYQQQRDWEKAIAMAKQLEGTSHAWQAEVAEYHCEIAHRAISSLDYIEAEKNLVEALVVHRQCTRATIMQGELALLRGSTQEAINIWLKLESQNADYLSLVADKILRAFEGLDKPQEGIALLKGLYESHPSLELLLPLVDALLDKSNLDEAYLLLKDELRRNPTMAALDKFLFIQLQIVPVDKRADIEQVRQLIKKQADKEHFYSCHACGFKARQYFWHCPGCGSWESYSPKRYQ
ncbi:lipopolysaccharide assembly protein LapB [Leeia sp. TBRC 13508]|uniref:Lipopolysaccharide assembly protein B n=1 Tax=Leeia speluncae TaxID=2884804 RepID=A0ABS8DB80_9NEIS|nr:lipopolysaccharide assembly protein LapB [Leeia speluncae]MCB6185263.1 lipopolysaccharide assembly protein LapB [Leeia speluncae]